jgi:hypothetical protein
MKNTLIYLFVLTPLIFFQVQGQSTDTTTGFVDSNANYTHIVQGINSYYSTLSSPDISEGSNLQEFSKWAEFWNNRTGNYNGNTGSFTPAMRQVMNVFVNPTSICNGDNNVNDPWANNLWTDITVSQLTYRSGYYPSQGKGRVNCIIVDLQSDPTGNLIYVGTPYSGIWATMNGKATTPNWFCITNSLRLPAFGINDMVLDPNNSNVMYVSTGIGDDIGDSYGIEGFIKLNLTKSSNNITCIAEATQLTSNISDGRRSTSTIAIIPGSSSASNIIFVAETNGSDIVIWKSTDGGSSFNKNIVKHLINTQYNPGIMDIKVGFDQSNNGKPTIFASTIDINKKNGGAKIFKSTDMGDSWIDITDVSLPTVDRIDIAVTPLDNNYIYALMCNDGASSPQSRMLKSIDKGDHWIASAFSSNNIGSDKSKNDIFVSTIDKNIVYFETFDLNKATWNGNSMTPLTLSCAYNCSLPNSNWIHPDQRRLFVMNDGTNDIVFSVNDGGLVKCTIQGTSLNWKDLTGSGLNISASYGLDITEKGDVLLAGFQDEGEYMKKNGNWITQLYQGDGHRTAIDKT